MIYRNHVEYTTVYLSFIDNLPCNLNIIFGDIVKGKLVSDMGHSGIRIGDTRVQTITVWTFTFGIQGYTTWSNGIMQYSLEMLAKCKLCV